MDEDWEDINSSISEGEWVEANSTGSRTPAPQEQEDSHLVSLNFEILRRLREAEARATDAEHRAAGLDLQLRVATDRITHLQNAVQTQHLVNNRLLSIVQQDERSRRIVVSKSKKAHQPSKVHCNRAPQSIRIPKKDYWAKNNHRSSCVASVRKI